MEKKGFLKQTEGKYGQICIRRAKQLAAPEDMTGLYRFLAKALQKPTR